MALEIIEAFKWLFASLAAMLYLTLTFKALYAGIKSGYDRMIFEDFLGSFKVLGAVFLVFYMQVKYVEFAELDHGIVEVTYFLVHLLVFMVLLRKFLMFQAKLQAIRRASSGA